MTLVILAAGLGSRYGGLKQLDPMTDAGNFIIDFSVYDAIVAGFDHVVFIIKEENLELFRDTIGKRIEKKIKVTYAFQKMEDLPAGFKAPEGRTKPLGTGHAIYCVRNLIKDNFAVINADDFYGRDTFMQLAKHLKDASSENGFAHHCMVGFRLKNTLTENGTVSRGQCFVDEKGMLESVAERTKIMKKEACAAYLEDDGETWVDLPFDTVVSMNCWGFTPSVFKYVSEGFDRFLASSPDPKAEYYLPLSVKEMIADGTADVTVYSTDAKWLGVTYKDDKPSVMAGIKSLIDGGEYETPLWK
jgi:dTDP-glucose pyrophosphorylase